METDQFECFSSDLTDGLQSNLEHCRDEEGEKVRRLWALPQNFNIPVAKVYDVCVTDTDIRSLKNREWLTDNVIDTYLKILTVELEESGGGKCMFLVSSTVGQIMNKTFSSRTSHKLSDYKLVVGAYIRASHWTLVVLDLQKEIVYFYNPVEGAEDIEMAFIKSSMCGFIAKCNQENEADVVRRWRVDVLPHSSQTDSFNCGVYCLLFAEKHLHGEFGDLTRITFETLKDMRLKIGKKMMLFEVYITDCCPKCGMNFEEQDQKLQCDTCGKSYHFKPYCVEEDINSLGDGDTFSCTLCRYNYWKCHSKKQCIGNNYTWIDKDQALNDLCESSRVDEEEVMIVDPAVTAEEPIDIMNDREKYIQLHKRN
ncbi:sentrin-specific protease 2-like [Mercenaria mercenaria]|uniref:sentrin-specific protease 2-like n=1 Tax=Mercenaria mercenaria TaxID=6596 RepID=UPI00234EB363|nr:sentrin-specific protease 2-like [Mercenaria mercenaria]